MNSATGPLTQLKAPAGICMVLRPCVTGVVLKWNTMVMFPFCKAKASAGMPFTVKSVGSTVAGSTGSLTLRMKSVGAVPVITPPQAALLTWQGIEVAVGVGVGLGAPDCAQYLPPVVEVKLPPQMIISLPVQTAVCCSRALGALVVLVAVQVSVPGLYLPPVLKALLPLPPPQTIISLPVQTALCRYRATGALVVLVAAQLSVTGL